MTLWIIFKNGATLLTRFDYNFERLMNNFILHRDIKILPGKYTFNNFFTEFTSDKSKRVAGKINITSGEFYDGKIWGYGIGTYLKQE